MAASRGPIGAMPTPMALLLLLPYLCIVSAASPGLVTSSFELQFPAQLPAAGTTSVRPVLGGLTSVSANYTVTASATEADPRLPLIFVLNGLRVESYWYSDLVAELAARGYTVVTADSWMALPPGLTPSPPAPGCAEGSDHSIGGIVSAFYGHLGELQGLPALAGANLSELVLLGHSQGGIYALAIAAGTHAFACEDVGAEVRRPSGDQRTQAGGGAHRVARAELAGLCDSNFVPSQGATLAYACAGYEPVDAQIAGVVVYEPVALGGFDLPAGRFATFMAGEFNAQTNLGASTLQIFEQSNTTGCASFYQFQDMNHYGLANFVGPAGRPQGQVPYCHSVWGPVLNITEAVQLEGVALIASVVDRSIRLAVDPGYQGRADEILMELEDNPRVVELLLQGPCA